MGIQQALLLLFIHFLIKNKGGGVNNEIKQNEQVAEELYKPIVKDF